MNPPVVSPGSVGIQQIPNWQYRSAGINQSAANAQAGYQYLTEHYSAEKWTTVVFPSYFGSSNSQP